MITIESKGSFKKTEDFLKEMSKRSIYKELDKYGLEGVFALENHTPIDSGLSATSWRYIVYVGKGYHSITWINDHVVDDIPVVILLQYGHVTGTDGYVEGKDFINPALKPIFNNIADSVWRAVKLA